MKYAISAPVLMTALLLPALASAEDWSFLEQRDDIRLYERSAEAHGEKALRATIEVSAPFERVLSVFVDPEERLNWVYRVAGQEILESEEPTDDIWSERYWTRIDMPFPVSDRDYVVLALYELDRESQRLTVHQQSIEDPRKPENGCCVRARSLSQYTLEALPDGQGTRIELTIETDLNGRVPTRLIRRAGPDWPVGTLRGLARRVQEVGAGIDARSER